MNGTGDGKFSPKANTTRGMIVTMLARVEGISTSGMPWYGAGQRWAMEHEISDGTNMPGAITREQLAAILYRYAKLKGYDVSKTAEISGYADTAQVSSYAADAMRWAVGSGLLPKGSSNRLNPKATATRAETAMILMRFMETFAIIWKIPSGQLEGDFLEGGGMQRRPLAAPTASILSCAS